MRVFTNLTKKTELPLKFKISFEPVYEYLENIVKDKDHYLHSTAKSLLEKYNKYPILRDGFYDFNYLEKYNTEIDELLNVIFPKPLQNNEIKAVTIPLIFTTFKLSNKFEKIFENAGDNPEFKLHNFDQDNLYILACTLILIHNYNVDIDFSRPFYFEIPDQKRGITCHYRIVSSGGFFKVKPLKNAVPITNDDIHLLIDNFHNIDLWKEKFPPESYEFIGFDIVNLFDITSDHALSKVKENLLKKDEKTFDSLEQSISNLFGTSNIKFGFAGFNLNNERVIFKYRSAVILNTSDFDKENFFCKEVATKVFEKKEIIAISNVDTYGIQTKKNGLYQVLKKQGIQSIVLIPINLNNDIFGVLELSSKNKYELNSVNVQKLEDVISVFKIAIQRYIEEFEANIESVIQENYTSLHPSVKWKFYEKAQEFILNMEFNNNETTSLKDIVFENVIPLFGECDIKGSSTARNQAIQEDLIKQLSLAWSIITKANKKYKLPIYEDLIFRINESLENIKKSLNSGDENSITHFLNKEIYPVFNHLKKIDKDLSDDIDNYMMQIDENLHVIYDKRKKFEDSVTILNDKLSKFIDYKQIEAQEMFPHYFERYKTDGVDYNMYIGQSLVKNCTYDTVYLSNLRLWQLKMTCELENIARNLKSSIPYPLDIASLILVHSNPLSIRFRMDEKKFDVDGAYNIRYEIIKKRIDKALIKNTNERLTQPGKIAIVYSNNNDYDEYMKYIKYLQSKKYLLELVEDLEIEDLQGVSGLKALRVSVNYNNTHKNKIAIDEFNEIIKSEN